MNRSGLVGGSNSRVEALAVEVADVEVVDNVCRHFADLKQVLSWTLNDEAVVERRLAVPCSRSASTKRQHVIERQGFM